MPLVRIDVQRGRTPEELRKLADTIQDVMLDVFAAPPRDRYQIITEHDKGHIIAEDTGLDIDRSDGIVIIQVSSKAGRPSRSWPHMPSLRSGSRSNVAYGLRT